MYFNIAVPAFYTVDKIYLSCYYSLLLSSTAPERLNFFFFFFKSRIRTQPHLLKVTFIHLFLPTQIIFFLFIFLIYCQMDKIQGNIKNTLVPSIFSYFKGTVYSIWPQSSVFMTGLHFVCHKHGMETHMYAHVYAVNVIYNGFTLFH